ncbi:T9SS type A sorting domain-containing protein [Flavobacterium sp. RHBU_3]|uniref:T9SS type A sorting domain-containing protein n=1 Tax=Flavobacterium sp. RHBU_3 TaxID=3391184 RepID=UPI0039851AF1
MKKIYLLLVLLLLAQMADAQVYGCTDPLSATYNPDATINDGSCTYPSTSVTPVANVTLPGTVDETSGLVLWDSYIYTHNDDTDTHLYRIDPTNGEITQTLNVAGSVNQDWEDIDQDEAYVYIGDFGNNVNGNRTNLHILKVAKAGLLAGAPVIESINFTYSDQASLAATVNNHTDFDCEAMIVGTNYIYLFTKQWVSKKTSLYRLPKTAGNQTAQLLATYNVNGLVTGATWLPQKRVIALCGYSTTLSPFIYLLYDFQGEDFFGGNKRKLNVSVNFLQTEGITTKDGVNYYLSNEHFEKPPFLNSTARLFTVNLTPYLQGYLSTAAIAEENGLLLYPNPAKATVTLEAPETFKGSTYTIFDVAGKEVADGDITDVATSIDVSTLSTGIYTVRIEGTANGTVRLIKQ